VEGKESGKYIKILQKGFFHAEIHVIAG